MTGFEDLAFSLTQQCVFFLCSILLGGVIGIIYDVFRIVRIAVSHNSITVFFEDLLFCAITCMLLIVTVFCANYGIVRWFGIFGTASGFFVYGQTVGKIVIGCATVIIRFVKMYIISPVFWLFKMVIYSIARMIVHIKQYVLYVRCLFIAKRLLISARSGFGL